MYPLRDVRYISDKDIKMFERTVRISSIMLGEYRGCKNMKNTKNTMKNTKDTMKNTKDTNNTQDRWIIDRWIELMDRWMNGQNYWIDGWMN